MAVDHYENFPVASLLMPAALREPVIALYGFARNADDIADEGDAAPAQRLAQLDACRAQLDRIDAGQTPTDAIHARLAHAVRAHDLPLALCRDLIDAFAQDVTQTRYADYAQLLEYCRRSANPVGRLLLRLYRHEDALSLERSDAICTALQLINHWQDVAIDWRKNPEGHPPGRVYLPLADMAAHGVSEAHIAAQRVDANWVALMRCQVERARALMLHGAPLALALPGRLGWELRLIVHGGLRILARIEAAGYDVFRQRPTLGLRDWLAIGRHALFYRLS